ncbi:hypothetical protein EVAR_88360_1 [Eumeta japonica]|uniref:Uncharacterized protein n=1 Tax=Eumeta variegata TaxID=151549 RepID=A0A4C1XDY4_EUMVA|nr:hypothetical protein EVAR_88360_1 [Eumeta japonica]
MDLHMQPYRRERLAAYRRLRKRKSERSGRNEMKTRHKPRAHTAARRTGGGARGAARAVLLPSLTPEPKVLD